MSSSVNSPTKKPVSLVWLRRDLRLHDHAVLAEAVRAGETVQPVFIFDTDILKRFKHRDDRRLTFIAETLCRMHKELSAKNSGLLIFYGRAEKIIPELCRAVGAITLFAAEDFEPATRARDVKVEMALQNKTAFKRVLDHLLTAPDEVMKKDGTPYKVFTPYSRAWRALAKDRKKFADEASIGGLKFAIFKDMQTRLKGGSFTVLEAGKGPEALLKQMGYQPARHGWPVTEARSRLHAFSSHRMKTYARQRDFMAVDGTSRLSPYLRFGLLSIRECARAAFNAEAHGDAGASTWINELIWRDFYAMILYHFPETESQEMQTQYRKVKWSYDEVLFKRFAEGKTGFPVIDAAMRQLLAEGYMHNRARMIVASFMTKDLLLDWRLGEEHFAQYLMDYELSSNVGGWQWASSTGTDAQPYFRVFNPLLQSQRFDPKGDYIRAHVPELAHMKSPDIHEPWRNQKPRDYPKPIVDHAKAKEKAVAAFRQVRSA